MLHFFWLDTNILFFWMRWSGRGLEILSVKLFEMKSIKRGKLASSLRDKYRMDFSYCGIWQRHPWTGLQTLEVESWEVVSHDESRATVFLTAECSLLLFVRGVSFVGHQPQGVFLHLRLGFAQLLSDAWKVARKKEEENKGSVGGGRREGRREGEKGEGQSKKRERENPLRSPMLAGV